MNVMIPLLLFLASTGSQTPSELASVKAYIEHEFAQHVREFKEDDPKTISNFWFKNCLAGFQQFDVQGRKYLYDFVLDTYQRHPASYQKNLERIMRLVKIEKVKEGYAVLVEQGWTALARTPPNTTAPPLRAQTHSILQEIWVKTRRGFGMNFTEVLYFQQGDTIDFSKQPHKIWNGRLPEIPKQLLAEFQPKQPVAHK